MTCEGRKNGNNKDLPAKIAGLQYFFRNFVSENDYNI